MITCWKYLCLFISVSLSSYTQQTHIVTYTTLPYHLPFLSHTGQGQNVTITCLNISLSMSLFLLIHNKHSHSHTLSQPPFSTPRRTECYDYLFDIAVQMTKMGLDPSKPPGTQEQVNGKWVMAGEQWATTTTTTPTAVPSNSPAATMATHKLTGGGGADCSLYKGLRVVINA